MMKNQTGKRDEILNNGGEGVVNLIHKKSKSKLFRKYFLKKKGFSISLTWWANSE